MAVSIALAVTLAAESAKNLSAIMTHPQNVEWQAAQELARLGARHDSLVALLGHSNVADYYAHLAKVRIVAEVPSEGVSSYWDADGEVRRRILNLFAQTGATVLVTLIPPPDSKAEDWRPLGGTGYYAHRLAATGTFQLEVERESCSSRCWNSGFTGLFTKL